MKKISAFSPDLLSDEELAIAEWGLDVVQERVLSYPDRRSNNGRRKTDPSPDEDIHSLD